ncbi:YcgN family cysteine cluster protein [Pararhodospirillum photometricum]|nr:YcgN family cysteine cluster protein [Pararhodospirillum photometricum]
MTETEWESLCDGCGKCCLHKLQEEDTGHIHYTNVACELLDLASCQCADYVKRWDTVPDCVKLTPRLLHRLAWMPETCAYRLLARGEPLPPWHPLETGDPESVHRAGMSARGRAVSELDAGPLEDHIVEWSDL